MLFVIPLRQLCAVKHGIGSSRSATDYLYQINRKRKANDIYSLRAKQGMAN